jgi:hypothetical protein
MGGTPDIITKILTEINYCEFCDRPADCEHECNIYTIDKVGTGGLIDISKNIIVMCPECKQKYDAGVFGKKHLKACVMMRDPGLSKWLIDLFQQYDIRLKQNTVKKGLKDRALDWLFNVQEQLDNVMLLFGLFFIIVGILLFAYGYSVINGYENGSVTSGEGAGNYLFYQFFELAGVALALIGLFFELCQADRKGKPDYR